MYEDEETGGGGQVHHLPAISERSVGQIFTSLKRMEKTAKCVIIFSSNS